MSDQSIDACCGYCPARSEDGLCTRRLKYVGDSHPACSKGKRFVQAFYDSILFGLGHAEPIGLLGDKDEVADGSVWIHDARGTGKTTKLIEMAERDDLYIIVRDEGRKAIIRGMAKRMGKNIRNPISLSEIRYGHCVGDPYLLTHSGVLVDDVLDILEDELGAHVVAAVANEPGWVRE